MQMRPSRVLAKLRSGRIASCVKLNLGDPRAAEIGRSKRYRLPCGSTANMFPTIWAPSKIKSGLQKCTMSIRSCACRAVAIAI